MKKMLCIVPIVIFINTVAVVAFLLDTTQAKEVIPTGYIPLSECIPLEDIACWFMDDDDYSCLELKDVATQYNSDNTRSYAEIFSELPNETADFQENFVDMRSVVDFAVAGNGLQLYFEDGTGYYLEID